MSQGGEGIRTSGVAVQGGAFNVEVGPNDSTVEVSASGSSTSTSHDVEPNKTASIPVPAVPAGTVLMVTVGKGARARTVIIEVIAPTP